MARVDTAQLMSLAYYKPDRLDDERQRLLAKARRGAVTTPADEHERGLSMARRIRRALRLAE